MGLGSWSGMVGGDKVVAIGDSPDVRSTPAREATMTRGWTVAGLLGLGLAAGALAAEGAAKTLFDGKSGEGWIINKGGGPLPRANIQDGSINPHDSGGYVVVHEKQYKDFVLDF